MLTHYLALQFSEKHMDYEIQEIIKLWYGEKYPIPLIVKELDLPLVVIVEYLAQLELVPYIVEGDGKIRTARLISCDVCNTKFLRNSRGIKEINYCSRDCSYKGRQVEKIIVTCAHCGSIIKRTPSKLKNSRSGLQFCNRKCKEEGQKYIKEIQPDHYGKTTHNYRKIAFEKYEKVCVDCGYANELALEVHHLDRNRDNNSIENLVVLCANCHTIRHKLEN